MLVKYCNIFEKNVFATQELPIKEALALLELTKVSNTIGTKWTGDNIEYQYVCHKLYIADKSEGTVNMLVIYCEAKVA